MKWQKIGLRRIVVLGTVIQVFFKISIWYFILWSSEQTKNFCKLQNQKTFLFLWCSEQTKNVPRLGWYLEQLCSPGIRTNTQNRNNTHNNIWRTASDMHQTWIMCACRKHSLVCIYTGCKGPPTVDRWEHSCHSSKRDLWVVCMLPALQNSHVHI